MRPLFLAFLLVGCGARVQSEEPADGATTSPTGTPTTSPTGGTDKGDAGFTPPPGCAFEGLRARDFGEACFDEAHWKEVATDACQFKGGVASFALETGCGLFRYRNFRCCGADGVCTDHRDGGEGSCKDEALWRSYSVKNCELEKRTLASLTFDTPCGPTGAGGAHGATYQCCKP